MGRNILILVHTHEIEPIVFLGSRLVKLDFTISECSKQTLISNIAHAI